MENCLVPNCFVQPRFIEELGCEGLSLHDIAKSIGVEFSCVKTKFERMLSDNRVKSLHVQIEVVYDSGLRTERKGVSWALATDTAKFFVAKWDSELGDAYCRFLVECEKALTNMMEELPPELKYLIRLSMEQKEQKKKLEQIESTLQSTNLSLLDCPLSTSQIETLENMFSELFRKTGDGRSVGRAKSALKAQFLNCAKSGVTYKSIAQKHFSGCVDMVQQKIDAV
jgi:hypothetical protein